jgi:hypothetical protein
MELFPVETTPLRSLLKASWIAPVVKWKTTHGCEFENRGA